MQRTEKDWDFWQQTDPPSCQRLHCRKTKTAIVKTQTKIWSWVLVGAWCKDKLTDWLTTSCKVTSADLQMVKEGTASFSHLRSSRWVLVLKLYTLQLQAVNIFCIFRQLWHNNEMQCFSQNKQYITYTLQGTASYVGLQKILVAHLKTT